MSLKSGFMSDCISLMAVWGGSGVHLHPPFQPPTSHYWASARTWEWATQLLLGRTVQTISTLAHGSSVNHAPAHADLWEV